MRRRRRDTFGHCERPDDHGDQVGRQRRRRRKTVPDQTIAGVGMARLRRVRSRRKAGLGRQRDGERRLEARLVKGRKSCARIDRFKLRPGVPVVADLDVIKAFGAIAERCIIIELERDFTSLERRGEGNLRDTEGIDLLPGDRGFLAVLNGDGVGNVEVTAMHVERSLIAFQRHIDFGVAGKALLIGHDLEV